MILQSCDLHEDFMPVFADDIDCPVCKTETGHAKLKETLESHRWIPVKERLPVRFGEYLILPYIKHCATLWWQGKWYWYDEVSDDILDSIGRFAEKPIPTVTHWKPIILLKE